MARSMFGFAFSNAASVSCQYFLLAVSSLMTGYIQSVTSLFFWPLLASGEAEEEPQAESVSAAAVKIAAVATAERVARGPRNFWVIMF